jgi:hypothetical protein
VQCRGGICRLVLVDLESGGIRELVAGTPDVVWHRPRFSPDGSTIAASVQDNGTWSVALVDSRTGAVRRLPAAEGVSRYAPSFTAGRELVAVSEAGGIANLEFIPLDSGATRTLTRVTGAVLAPDVNRTDGSVWYLTLRTGGYDLRRIQPSETTTAEQIVSIQGDQVPAAPPSLLSPPALPDSTAVGEQSYGLGPREWRVLPGTTIGADGLTGTLMVANIDPIARLSVVMQAGTGTAGTWQGGSLAATWRREVTVEGSSWLVEHEPSRQPRHLAPSHLDSRYAGAGLLGRVGREGSATGYLMRFGGTAGVLDGPAFPGEPRHALVGEWRGRWSRSSGVRSVHVVGGLTQAIGRTGEYRWQRTVGSLGVVYSSGGMQVRGDWLRGRSASKRDGWPVPAMEQFLVGGSPNPYVDPLWMTHRIAMPSVPAGFVAGRELQLFRASVSRGGWEPYVTWVAAGSTLDDVKRVAGIEQQFSVSALGFARLPSVRIRAGAAYSFDAPVEKTLRAYASVVFSP